MKKFPRPPIRIFSSGKFWLSPVLVIVLVANAAIINGVTDDDAGPISKEDRTAKDQWERIEVSGKVAGYGRIREHTLNRGNEKLRQIESVMRMRMKRMGEPVETAILVQATFDRQDRMVDFRTETSLGGQAMISTGSVQGKRLEITTELGTALGGKVVTDQIDWSDETHGLFYERRMLETNPMLPGEQRTFAALIPIFNRVARTTLKAGDWSRTDVLGTSKELLPIASDTMLAGQQLTATLWMDRDGQIIKTEEPTLGQTVTRTTREKALAGKPGAAPDLITGTVIPLKFATDLPSEPHELRYRVRTNRPLSKPPFPNTSCQICSSSKDARVWDLRVTAVENEEPTRDIPVERPTARDQEPHRFVDQNDAAIRKLAATAGSTESEVALANLLAMRVYSWISRKDFSTVLATASEVVRTRSGDCTEHAVLLAAMAKARGLPARVVVGLVYVPSLGGFAYHMWNQIWCDGAWRFFDATRSDGRCGAGHIKVADDPLADENGLTIFLPVLQLMGGTEIELISADDDVK